MSVFEIVLFDFPVLVIVGEMECTDLCSVLIIAFHFSLVDISGFIADGELCFTVPAVFNEPALIDNDIFVCIV